MSRYRQRLCAVVGVLALLAGGLTGPPIAARCRQCRPGCPMHAGHLECHHATHGTAQGPGQAGIRCACGHGAESVVPAFGIRAILTGRSEAPRVMTGSSLTSHVWTAPTRLLPEPPTDPPRAIVA